MIHLIYPANPDRSAAPWSIGNALLDALGKSHEVAQHDWTDRKRIRLDLSQENILLGHPHPEPGYIFESSLYLPWDKRLAICPYNGEDPYWLRSQVRACDHYLAICGPRWGKKLHTFFQHSTRLDMAINQKAYPQVKDKFRPPGERRFLYIGCTVPVKGTAYLESIIEAMPGTRFGHVGHGLVRGAYPHGYIDLETDQGRSIVAGYDFLIMPGSNDANPTTVPEATSWGLVPICTPTCGWGADMALNLSTELDSAVHQLDTWQNSADAQLEKLRAYFLENLGKHTWDRFTSNVLGVINGKR